MRELYVCSYSAQQSDIISNVTDTVFKSRSDYNEPIFENFVSFPSSKLHTYGTAATAASLCEVVADAYGRYYYIPNGRNLL